MATHRGQTHAKRDRETAQREKRERKRARRAEVAAQRAAGKTPPADIRDAHAGSAEWLR